jgi:hypothetical protein
MVLNRFRKEAGRQNWFGIAVDLAILVVGIFLGIQVTNLNQDRIDRANGKEYRQRLIFDIESNQLDVDHRIRYDGKVMGHAKAALAALDRPAGDDPGAFLIHAYEASNHIPQPIRHFTYDEAVSGGNEEFLGDKMLRERIANYYVGLATMQRLLDNVPAYRDIIRSAMPYAVQARVLEDCTEVFETDRFGSVTTNLPDHCKSTLDPRTATAAATEVRAVPHLRWELNRVVADLDQKIWNARRLAVEAERLKGELRAAG